ncbi:hypothetical protein QBC33DRAFT_544066, partial [Phialemonium atrogriseum]
MNESLLSSALLFPLSFLFFYHDYCWVLFGLGLGSPSHLLSSHRISLRRLTILALYACLVLAFVLHPPPAHVLVSWSNLRLNLTALQFLVQVLPNYAVSVYGLPLASEPGTKVS